MKMPDIKRYEEIIYKFIAVISAASITGLLSKDKNIVTKLKNLCAGVLGGGIVIIFSISYNAPPIWVLFGCVFVSAFISSFWPVFGEIGMTIVNKYLRKTKKKDEDESV